jgi:hypothetical protein
MKINTVNTLALFFGSMIFFSLSFSACKNDAPETKPGSLSLHIHTAIDLTEIENYGDTLVLAGGRKIVVTTTQLYISNIKLIKSDGGVLDVPNSILLVKQGIEDYDLGSVSSGNYKSVSFDVGLSNTTNASTPPSSDLVLYQPSMWFGTTAQPEGFVFVNFQGKIDTTLTATGTQLIPFVYKIGTNAHRVTITLPDQNYSVLPEEQTVIHLYADYARLLDGIQLNRDENLIIDSPETNAWAWIDQMETNMGTMFSYE